MDDVSLLKRVRTFVITWAGSSVTMACGHKSESVATHIPCRWLPETDSYCEPSGLLNLILTDLVAGIKNNYIEIVSLLMDGLFLLL